jgi:N-acetyl-alpha-D-muramate 1-phosphate uridylyltransferase
VSEPEQFPVAILAGGLATRLRPLTDTIPKALIDVDGTPFIGLQLELLRRQHVREVVICAAYLGEMIQDSIGDGRAFDLQVRYSFDGAQLLGTAGSLRKARNLLGKAFFVLYGDSYLPCDYAPIRSAFIASGQPALMTVYRNDGRWDRSNVRLTDGKIECYDKASTDPAMRHIDYGLGVLTQRALDQVPSDQPSDLAVLYQQLLAQDQLAAFEVPERFYEIGSFEGLTELRQHLRLAPSSGGRQ